LITACGTAVGTVARNAVFRYSPRTNRGTTLRWILSTIVAAGALAAMAQERAPATPEDVPAWAFPAPRLYAVPDSARKITEVVQYDQTRAIDWFPEEHPAMPDAVKGRMPIYACSFCHLPTGGGRAGNGSLAGLSANYIREQVASMRNGARTYDARFTTGLNMVLVAKKDTEADVDAAAKYYAGLRYRKLLKVVEATQIPRVTTDAVYIFHPDGAMEPLGERIIEGPDDAERFRRRDPNTTYTAYVPVGSMARGAALARGTQVRPACDTCHGPGLTGSEIAPPLAGRFATGVFRQLYDFRSRLRNGPQAALMQPVVEGLSMSDMIALAAYAASLEP
jgi:cytochrome c553